MTDGHFDLNNDNREKITDCHLIQDHPIMPKTTTPPISSMQVELLETHKLYHGFFQLFRYRLRYQRFDGHMSQEVTLEALERGDAVAVLAYDPHTDLVGLIQQFRIGPHLRENQGWCWEIVAGSCRSEEAYSKVAEREVAEEAGWSIQTLRHILTYYLSPSGSTERIHLFLALFDSQIPPQGGGGLLCEAEDIHPQILPFPDAWTMVENGSIHSGTAILALQWLAMHRAKLQHGDY
ncbi:MAG: NUDIX domain-containing protein [Magnetococcus sp. DMHC-6]